MQKTKLELTWIGKEHRPKLEPRILLENTEKSFHAPHRITDHDVFDNRPISGDNRDKASLDIFWLRDENLEDSDNLSDPDVVAQEIVVPRLASLGTTPSQDSRPARGPRRGVEDLEAALEQFREIMTDFGRDDMERKPDD